MQTRKEILDRMLDEGVVAIVRQTSGEHLLETARAIAAGGVKVIEFTLNTPGAIGAIRACRGELPEVLVGAGTVLNDRAAQQAIEAGAEFIVSPNTKASVIEMTHMMGKVSIPGAYTPTEVGVAMDLYADIVKLFPADDLGSGYVRCLKGPFENLNVMPTGGVGIENVREYILAGACAVGVGGAIACETLVKAGNFEEITRRAEAFRAAVDAARQE